MGRIASRINSAAGDSLLDKGPNGQVRPRNFIISGGTADDRHATFLQMYDRICGQIPVIYLHTRDDGFLDEIVEITRSRNQLDRLQVFNVDSPGYGYLNQVSQQGVVNTLELLAKSMGYDCPPQFDRTVKIMISLAKEFGFPSGLAGLSKLAEFTYVDLRSEIGARLGKKIENALANDMEVSGRPECFYLFQAVIQKLAHEARLNSWTTGEDEKKANRGCCIEAIKNRNSLFLEMRGGLTELVEQCICSELREARSNQFLFVVDGLPVSQQGLGELTNRMNFKWGIISEDAFPVLGEELFPISAEKAEIILVLKHKTGPAAQRYSELMGCKDVQISETSEGTAKEAFKVLPGSSHRETRYSIENRYRVMPERIMALQPCEVILFETTQNKIRIV